MFRQDHCQGDVKHRYHHHHIKFSVLQLILIENLYVSEISLSVSLSVSLLNIQDNCL